jgi:uncharacterized protein YecE (DUF72 family)
MAGAIALTDPLEIKPAMNDTIFHIGTSGYSYKEWKGSFYPKDLAAKRMLHYYGQRFRTVEMNNTFYRLPNASVAGAWAAEVPADFQFVLKAPQRITHVQRLQKTAESVAALLEISKALKGKSGPLLFQLPPNFKKDVPRLREFLTLLPSRERVAFEFRHASWLDQDVFDLLRDHQAALCVAESENGVDAPLLRTADWAYLRLRLEDYSDPYLKAWVERARQHKWREVFVFFKHEDEGKGPHFAERLMQWVGEPPASSK